LDTPRILVAYDFSNHGRAVLAHAQELARSAGLAIELLHVAAPDPDFVGYEAGPQSVRDARADTLREERSALQARADELAEAGVEATPRLVEGPTVEVLLEHAAAEGVRMIVMGTQGRTGLAKIWMGSVAEGVLQGAACPVVVIPRKAVEALGPST
jgi:nucleotide-binding universal stress UspA family protein